MPRVAQPVYRSLQSRWDVIKTSCSHWSEAPQQVGINPPSGINIEDYDRVANERYKAMKMSKGKPFTLQHCWKLLEHIRKWNLRDQEEPSKKEAMKEMDDASDEEERRNKGKPEGNKKEKERIKIEAEAPSLRDKIDEMAKSKETLMMKMMEAKMKMNEKKN